MLTRRVTCALAAVRCDHKMRRRTTTVVAASEKRRHEYLQTLAETMYNRSALGQAKSSVRLIELANNNNTTSGRPLPVFRLIVVSVICLVILLSPAGWAADAVNFYRASREQELHSDNGHKWPAKQSNNINDNNNNNSSSDGEKSSIFERLFGSAGGGGETNFFPGARQLLSFSSLETGAADGDHHQLEINKLAESLGFSIQTHWVATSDGYILTLHRLTNPLLVSGPKLATRGAPIILQHGLLSASPFFLMNSSPQLDRPSKMKLATAAAANEGAPANNEATTTSNSLALELAQRGHDVWLANFRGGQYSRSHQRQDLNEGGQNETDYWEFNVDTLIERDLSAYVHYVLDLTASPRYVFIGHSLGATIGLGSLLVHAQSRITRQLSCALLMAPVASTQFMRGRLMSLFRAATLLYPTPGPFPGATRTFSSFVRRVCPHLRQLCLWLASMFIGAKRNVGGNPRSQSIAEGIQPVPSSPWWHSNRTTTTTATTTSPTAPTPAPTPLLSAADGTDAGNNGVGEFQNQVNTFLMMMRQSVSVQMLQHIVQVHSSGRLSRFNYGPSANKLRYGSTLAPIYDLSKISQPHLKLAIVSGQSDAISTPGEVHWISEQVRDKVGLFEQITVPVSPFNHMDLIMSSEAGKFVNKQMLQFIKGNKCLDTA